MAIRAERHEVVKLIRLLARWKRAEWNFVMDIEDPAICAWVVQTPVL